MSKKKKYIPDTRMNPAVMAGKIDRLSKRIEEIQLTSLHQQNALKDFIVLITNFATHDIKNSVHSIDGIISNVKPQDITQEDYVNIQMCLDHVRSVLDSFAQFNMVKLDEVGFDIQKLFTSVNILHRPQFKMEKISFSIEFDDSYDKKQVMENDFHSLLFMFNNLVLNSIYALRGIKEAYIKFFVSTFDDAAEKMLKVIVCDNGCGVKDEDRNKIFDAYYTTKSSGSGVGLTHVQWLLEKMGKGSIKLLDEPTSSGASFEIIVPFKFQNQEDE